MRIIQLKNKVLAFKELVLREIVDLGYMPKLDSLVIAKDDINGYLSDKHIKHNALCKISLYAFDSSYTDGSSTDSFWELRAFIDMNDCEIYIDLCDTSETLIKLKDLSCD